MSKSGLKDGPAVLDMLDTIEPLRSKLFAAREKRVHPYKDDKILTAWNGLMLAALAKGRRVLQNARYGNAAAAAVEFIWHNLRRQDGRLLARYRDGEAAIPAYLDDYAFLTWGLLELYEATFLPHYLEKAITLTDQMLELFGDDARGGFFFYGRDGEQLIARPKETYDGALPSGNSVATLNLLRLARITAKPEYEQAAQKQVRFFAPEVSKYPPFTFFLTALQFVLAEPQQVIIAGQAGEGETEAMLAALQKKYLPQASLLFYPQDETGNKLEAMLPFLENYRAVNGRATAYLCKNYSCQAPITDYQQLLQQI